MLPCPYLQIRAVAIYLLRTHLPMSLPKPSNLASRSFPPPLQPSHPGPACMLSHFSCFLLYLTLWTVACQASLFMGLSRQEYWSRLPFPPPGDLPDPGIEPASPATPVLQADSLPLSHRRSHWKAHFFIKMFLSLPPCLMKIYIQNVHTLKARFDFNMLLQHWILKLPHFFSFIISLNK